MSTYTKINIQQGRQLKGQASLYQRGNRVLIRLPDAIGLGRNKYWSTGLPANNNGIIKAKQLLSIVNSDIVFEQFDPTLEKYKPLYKRERYMKEVEQLIGNETPLAELWDMYCDSKKNKIKESTYDYLKVTIGDRVKHINIKNIHDVESVRLSLISHTTEQMTERVLVKISGLFDWCMTKKIIKADYNPYSSVIKDFREGMKDKEDPTPRPLTNDEVAILFEKMGVKYHNLIKFSLMVGCRPSEAIGIEWQDIDIEKGYMTLGRSVRVKSKTTYRSEKSKNNKRRQFPLNDKLLAHLQSLPKTSKLVNPDTNGKAFTYNAYYLAWRKIMPKDTTPYCCRDTFISNQIEKGIPPAVVAQWCDNSVTTIEKHYLKISNAIKPI